MHRPGDFLGGRLNHAWAAPVHTTTAGGTAIREWFTAVERNGQPVIERPSPEELARLGAAIPPQVHFGTSTWNYPGWTGLVYQKTYPAAGLADTGLPQQCEIFDRVTDRLGQAPPVDGEQLQRFHQNCRHQRR